MHPKIDEILEYLKSNEYFKTIKEPEKFAKAIYDTYPTRDLVAEFRKANLWLTANPKRQKKDYRRFLVNWANNAFSKKHYFINAPKQ